jgi:hypothetical protein
MQLSDLIHHPDFDYLTPQLAVTGDIPHVRSCDLLSWVMAKGQRGEAWVTVQTHSNIVAVASLLELGCIILPESLQPDEETLQKALSSEVPLLSTSLDTYGIMQLFFQT